jgi:hypothetical protein
MRLLKIIGTLFVVVGVLLLVGGFFSYKHTRRFIAHSTVTRGEVIDLVLRATSDSDSPRSDAGVYYPLIRFETESHEAIEFMGSTGSNPPSHRKGDTIAVRYDSDDPYRARVDSFFSLWLFAVIPGALGLVFVTAGGIMTGIAVRHAGMLRWLEDFGSDITTEFQSVSLDRSVAINHRHPYRIFSQWHDPTLNRVFTFQSKAVWFNPEKYIQGKDIRVRIDPNNPRRYVMDTSFLPEAE